MAHPLNDMVAQATGTAPFKCNVACKYWKFPHLDKACVLSDVYSVKKGEPCYNFALREDI